MNDADEMATMFAQMLCTYHAEQLKGPEVLRNAIIVKMVALIALAFDVPPTSDELIDIDDTIKRLLNAMHIIKAKTN